MPWLVLQYRPTSLFSLKTSRATSTVGKTLLVPTPYAIKMAFVDAGLRTGSLADPDAFIKALASTEVRVGVPEEACVTATIQKIRQEPKKQSAEQPYIPNVAFREVVYFRGLLLVAFEQSACPPVLAGLAPAVNYLGKRASFVQYECQEIRADLDSTFTLPLNQSGQVPPRCHLATLDDFGREANFEALNSFSNTPIKRGKHRTWIEAAVPLGVYNVGPGFVHYKR